MTAKVFWSAVLCAAVMASASRAQLAEGVKGDTVRVTVSINQDGSRTAYEFDPAKKKATATIVNADGKPQGKIFYELDDAGRFATGEVLDAAGRFQFKTLYKYDANGPLLEETQLTKDGTVVHKLVYAYGPDGKQTGYSVYDGRGKLLGQTKPVSPLPAVKKKSK